MPHIHRRTPFKLITAKPIMQTFKINQLRYRTTSKLPIQLTSITSEKYRRTEGVIKKLLLYL